MKIVTWNCNGIRARFDLIKKLINDEEPDIIFLQETKIEDKIFPSQSFHDLGYKYLFFRGEKSYNGVACISKIQFDNCGYRNWVQSEDCRHIFIKLNDLEIHNFYVPAGGDIPNTKTNKKFLHKLLFLFEIKKWLKNKPNERKEILLGDLNIAPLPDDVWSHKQLLNVVSHTPEEVELLEDVMVSGNFYDVIRSYFPVPEKVFSWWSYRSKDWQLGNRGRRLDHIWATNILFNNVKNIKVIKDARGWEKPSDHVPVVIEIDLKD